MKSLIEDLKLNPKIKKVDLKLKPSLSEEPEVEKISLTVKTERSLTNLCKYIGIKPTEDLMYIVKLYCPNDPTTTLLKDLFIKYSIASWNKPKYAHENPMIVLKLNKHNLSKIINYVYSTIN